MRNASGHQCKEKMRSSEKKKREHVRHFLQSSKTTANKCKKEKSVLQVQSCFFAN